MSQHLYRHFDAVGRLLYVGISLNALIRLEQHRRAPWFNDIATITIEHFGSREAVLEAEARAIETEKPIHNVQKNPHRVIRSDATADEYFLGCGAYSAMSAETGLTRRYLRDKVESGEWTEGFQFKRLPSGRLAINQAGFSRWVEGGQA